MAGQVYGADVAELRSLSERMSRSAADLDQIANLLTHQITGTTAWVGPSAQRFRSDWSDSHRGAVASSARALRDCSVALRRNADEQDKTSAADSSSAAVPSAGRGPGASGTAVNPPGNGSPGDSAAWWNSLSAQQQKQVIHDHPDWIGNRDGVPFTARDQANRALISVCRKQLMAEKQRLEQQLDDNLFGGTFTNDDTRLDQVNAKLKSLDAIDKTLGQGGRQLLLLDVAAERVEAAIANGNVDTADNVAVFVPGLDTTVDGDLRSSDERMDEMQKRTELESRRAGVNESAATVTWIGYQTPQSGWDLINPDRSVANDNCAERGAAKLAPFLLGIGAARESDAHLTVLAHSYGSTTAGLALQQDTGVDDVVFFGSPGIGTDQVQDLKVPRGHTYLVEARNDFVGDMGAFGGDPSLISGIGHASARESTVVDPVTGEILHFNESIGHSGYLDNQSTSQYNMSLIVAGLPGEVVPNAGIGIGDFIGLGVRSRPGI